MANEQPNSERVPMRGRWLQHPEYSDDQGGVVFHYSREQGVLVFLSPLSFPACRLGAQLLSKRHCTTYQVNKIGAYEYKVEVADEGVVTWSCQGGRCGYAELTIPPEIWAQLPDRLNKKREAPTAKPTATTPAAKKKFKYIHAGDDKNTASGGYIVAWETPCSHAAVQGVPFKYLHKVIDDTLREIVGDLEEDEAVLLKRWLKRNGLKPETHASHKKALATELIRPFMSSGSCNPRRTLLEDRVWITIIEITATASEEDDTAKSI